MISATFKLTNLSDLFPSLQSTVCSNYYYTHMGEEYMYIKYARDSV